MRLLNKHRKMILHSILDNAFKKVAEETEDKLSKLAIEIYELIFNGDERRLMATLPNGWLAKLDTFRIRIDTETYSFSFPKGISKPFPENVSKYSYAIAKDYHGDEPIAKKAIRLVQKRNIINGERNSARVQIAALLGSFHSPAKVKKVWPEISDVVDKICVESSNTDLAPQLKSLNELLGLMGKSTAQ